MIVKAPLKPANFLLVPSELTEVLSWGPEVPLEDVAIATTSAYDRFVPGDRAHTTHVAAERTHQSAMLSVPDLSETRLSSNSKVGALLGPRNCGDLVTLLDLTEL